MQECLTELEEKGFLNCLESKADQYLYTIRDQREKLKHYVSGLLKESTKGITFETIYRRVSNQFGNFYTKDFVFRIIDELFQLGLIYEIAKGTYSYLDNNAI